MRRLDAMTRQLDLSEEQTAKIRELLTGAWDSADPAALREAIGALLTPEQREKLSQRSGAGMSRYRQRRDRAARTPRRMAEQGSPDAVRWLARALDLSAEQQARIKEAYDSHAAASRKRQAAFRDTIRTILTPQQIGRMRGRMSPMRKRMDAVRGRMDNARWRMWHPRRRLERARRTTRSERMGRRGNRRDRRSDLSVRLSAEQRETLGAVRREIDEARQSFAEEHPDATETEKRAFGASQRNKLAEAMESVLTAEQQLLMIRRTDRSRRPSSLLGLSEDQEARVKEVLAMHRKAAEDWVEANPNSTPDARMEHARAQWEALQSVLKEILTPEQMKRLDRSGLRRDRARQWQSQRIR